MPQKLHYDRPVSEVVKLGNTFPILSQATGTIPDMPWDDEENGNN